MKGGEEIIDIILSPVQFEVLNEVHSNPTFTQKQIAEKLGKSQGQISNILRRIRQNNPHCEELLRTIRSFDKRTSYRFYKFKSKHL